MALKTLSAEVRSNYKNTIGDYDISYNVTQAEGKPATDVNASVKKGEKKYGCIGISSAGRRSIIMDPGISDEDAKLICSTVIDDATQIFAERNA